MAERQSEAVEGTIEAVKIEEAIYCLERLVRVLITSVDIRAGISRLHFFFLSLVSWHSVVCRLDMFNSHGV